MHEIFHLSNLLDSPAPTPRAAPEPYCERSRTEEEWPAVTHSVCSRLSRGIAIGTTDAHEGTSNTKFVVSTKL